MQEPVFAIIGLGMFGAQLALSLSARNSKVLVIDISEESINKVRDKVTQAFLADATDENFLKRTPIENVDTAIVAISAFETCALAVAFLKQAGVPYIIARAETHIQSMILKKIGADEVIIVEVEQGIRLAKQLINPDMLDTMPLNKSLSLAEVIAMPALYNKSLKELAFPENFNISIIAIRRTGLRVGDFGEPEKHEEIIIPKANDRIIEGDVLLLVGTNENLVKLREG
jgi:trk system potassium uptake protein TrkA